MGAGQGEDKHTGDHGQAENGKYCDREVRGSGARGSGEEKQDRMEVRV